MSNLTSEQQQMAMLKLMAKQVELLEAIDWKLWQLHQKYAGDDAPAASGLSLETPDEDLPSIDRIERLP
jgi:hypothetical protein